MHSDSLVFPEAVTGPAEERLPGTVGDCGVIPHHATLIPLIPITHPAFVPPSLWRVREPCEFGGFVPFITMQTIFSCSQGRSGIPALFPGFLLAHEKRKNNKEPVWLCLAELWAEGDVTPSPAVTGCSQTGHALSRHGAALAAARLTPRPRHRTKALSGSIQGRTKSQPSVKLEGISPSAPRWLPALTPVPAQSSRASRLIRGAPAWTHRDDDDDGDYYLVEHGFVKLELAREISREGRKQNWFCFRG